MAHQELGMRVLERVRDDLLEMAVVEAMPRLEGRQMVMVLSPKKKWWQLARPTASRDNRVIHASSLRDRPTGWLKGL